MRQAVMTNPSKEAFAKAINDTGDGAISQQWIDSAYAVSRDWIAGSVTSAPYGRYEGKSSPLVVSWQWDSGTLTVTVSRD